MVTRRPRKHDASIRAALAGGVEDLSIAFRTRAGLLPVTRRVSFTVSPGERIGLVGESGCGKTVTGLALMRLLPTESAHVTGDVRLQGRSLMSLSERDMRSVRGREVAMIFQEPTSALDPVFTVGEQIAEAFRAHFPPSTEEKTKGAKSYSYPQPAAITPASIPRSS